MFGLYTADQIDEMFDAPRGRGNQKYPWHDMERGMSFFIKCDEYSENYRGPEVPVGLAEQGFVVTREKRPAKGNGPDHIVITRVE